MQQVTGVRIEKKDLEALREIEKCNGAKPAAQIRLAIAQYIDRWRAANKKSKGAAA
jgi:hypothetical protein